MIFTKVSRIWGAGGCFALFGGAGTSDPIVPLRSFPVDEGNPETSMPTPDPKRPPDPPPTADRDEDDAPRPPRDTLHERQARKGAHTDD